MLNIEAGLGRGGGAEPPAKKERAYDKRLGVKIRYSDAPNPARARFRPLPFTSIISDDVDCKVVAAMSLLVRQRPSASSGECTHIDKACLGSYLAEARQDGR